MTVLHDLPADEGPAPALRDLVDDLAVNLAAWVVVDRRGDVLAHAPSASPCPEPMARAILQRDASLPHQLWSARGRSREVAALPGASEIRAMPRLLPENHSRSRPATSNGIATMEGHRRSCDAFAQVRAHYVKGDHTESEGGRAVP